MARQRATSSTVAARAMMGLPIKSRVTAPIATLKGFAKYVPRRTLTSSGTARTAPLVRSQDTEFSQTPSAASSSLLRGTAHRNVSFGHGGVLPGPACRARPCVFPACRAGPRQGAAPNPSAATPAAWRCWRRCAGPAVACPKWKSPGRWSAQPGPTHCSVALPGMCERSCQRVTLMVGPAVARRASL